MVIVASIELSLRDAKGKVVAGRISSLSTRPVQGARRGMRVEYSTNTL